MNDFNSLPMNGEDGLRALATRAYGIKNVKQFGKAELVQMCEAAQAERDAAEAATASKPAKAAKPAKSRKLICVVDYCQERQDTSSIGPELCTFHLTEAEWENAHSDHGHDEIAAKIESQTELTEDEQHEVNVMEQCWTCHPGLGDANQKAPKAGTSRAGMVLTVPPKAPGELKAATTAARLAKAGIAHHVRVAPKAGVVILAITFDDTQVITLHWGLDGRYIYDQSTYKNKAGKVTHIRNNAAALRILGLIN